MNKVYVVQEGCIGDYSIAGIFSSMDKAQEFYCKMGKEKNYYLAPEQYVLDEKEISNPYLEKHKEGFNDIL